MKIYIIHAGIGHKSPYMEALKKHFIHFGFEVIFKINYPMRAPLEDEKIIYFHRLGRLYDSYDINTVKALLKDLRSLKKMGWVLIWTIHNFYPLDSDITDADYYLLKHFYKNMDYIFAHTNVICKSASAMFNRQIINHGFGVDFELKRPNLKKFSLKKMPKQFTFAFVGNIRKYKGIEELLYTYKKLCENNYKCNLLICGPQYKNYLKQRQDLVDIIEKYNVLVYDEYIYQEDWDILSNTVDTVVCPYLTNEKQFEFGFFPSSMAQISYHKMLMLHPISESIYDVLGTYDNSIAYDQSKKNSLYKGMISCMKISSGEKKNMINNQYNIIKKFSWDNVVSKVVNIIENYGIKN